MDKLKIMTIVGIRPDFIRMSLIIGLLDEAEDIEHILVHAGQHYSYLTDGVFFEELGIREPNHNFKIGSGTHAEQTAKLLINTETIIEEMNPDLVVYLGDSNVSLSAISASKMNVKIAHIEAGMRSYDWRMPEEKNRTIVDHLSDYLYVYTKRYRENVILEGIPDDKIIVVGNPIVDVIEKFLPAAKKREKIFDQHKIKPNEYILVTAHRAENVDRRKSLENILEGLKMVQNELKMPIIYPMYFRTQERIKEMGIDVPESITVIEPLGFLDFLQLEANARLLISDSGTVQEEGCILKVPCVTIRISTERPETVEVGANILSGLQPEDILSCSIEMMQRQRDWENPLGDGKSSERIVADIVNNINEIKENVFIIPKDDKRKEINFSTFVGDEVRWGRGEE